MLFITTWREGKRLRLFLCSLTPITTAELMPRYVFFMPAAGDVALLMATTIFFHDYF